MGITFIGGEASENVEIKVKHIEDIKLEKIQGKEIYWMQLPLSKKANDVWQKLFDEEYKLAMHSLKRPVHIYSEHIQAQTTFDNIEPQITWIKNLVELTNKRAIEHNKKVKNERSKREAEYKQEMEKIEEAKKKIKDSFNP